MEKLSRIEVTQRVNDKISCSGEWLPLISSRKCMQVCHLLHLVALLQFVQFTLLLQRFSFVQALLAMYSFEGPERFADIYRSPFALKGSQHDHSILSYLNSVAILHQNYYGSLNLRRGMLARSRGGRFDGHLLRAHFVQSFTVHSPLMYIMYFTVM